MNKAMTRLLEVFVLVAFVFAATGFLEAARTPTTTTMTIEQIQAIVDARINELVPPMIEAAVSAINAPTDPEPIIEPELEPEPVIEPTPDPEPDPEPAPTPTYDAIVTGTDGAAIQAAINSISSGVVYVPPGNYKTDTITLKSNITLSMNGVKLYNPTATAYKSMLWIGNGVSNVKILGGILEGPAAVAGASENYNTGISLWESPTNIIIKGVEIRYFMCDGIYIGCATNSDGAANGLLVEDCYIHHCGRNGISIISHRNATYRGNEIAYIGLNNTQTSTGSGIKFEANSSGGKNWTGENIVVEGNNIHDCHIFGIMVSDYWDRSNPYHPVSITVRDNIVQNNATLGRTSYSLNANNCLEFNTYTANRWVIWDGIIQTATLKTW